MKAGRLVVNVARHGRDLVANRPHGGGRVAKSRSRQEFQSQLRESARDQQLMEILAKSDQPLWLSAINGFAQYWGGMGQLGKDELGAFKQALEDWQADNLALEQSSDTRDAKGIIQAQRKFKLDMEQDLSNCINQLQMIVADEVYHSDEVRAAAQKIMDQIGGGQANPQVAQAAQAVTAARQAQMAAASPAAGTAGSGATSGITQAAGGDMRKDGDSGGGSGASATVGTAQGLVARDPMSSGRTHASRRRPTPAAHLTDEIEKTDLAQELLDAITDDDENLIGDLLSQMRQAGGRYLEYVPRLHGYLRTGDLKRMATTAREIMTASRSPNFARSAGDEFAKFIRFDSAELKKRIERDQHIVEGFASSETLDVQDDIVDPQAIIDALGDFMKWANLREMHENIASGTVLKAEPISGNVTLPDGTVVSNPLHIVAKVFDEGTWKKIKDGVLKGFSIGGKVVDWVMEMVDGKSIRRITKLLLTEISAVDRPANPDARILVFKRDSRGVWRSAEELLGLEIAKVSPDDMQGSDQNYYGRDMPGDEDDYHPVTVSAEVVPGRFSVTIDVPDSETHNMVPEAINSIPGLRRVGTSGTTSLENSQRKRKLLQGKSSIQLQVQADDDRSASDVEQAIRDAIPGVLRVMVHQASKAAGDDMRKDMGSTFETDGEAIDLDSAAAFYQFTDGHPLLNDPNFREVVQTLADSDVARRNTDNGRIVKLHLVRKGEHAIATFTNAVTNKSLGAYIILTLYIPQQKATTAPGAAGTQPEPQVQGQQPVVPAPSAAAQPAITASARGGLRKERGNQTRDVKVVLRYGGNSSAPDAQRKYFDALDASSSPFTYERARVYRDPGSKPKTIVLDFVVSAPRGVATDDIRGALKFKDPSGNLMFQVEGVTVAEPLERSASGDLGKRGPGYNPPGPVGAKDYADALEIASGDILRAIKRHDRNFGWVPFWSALDYQGSQTGEVEVFAKELQQAMGDGDWDKAESALAELQSALRGRSKAAGGSMRKAGEYANGRYSLGNLKFEGHEMPERYENLPGSIVIGGDQGDVRADEAYNDDGGVTLSRVQLITGLDDLTHEEAEEMARDIVEGSYESVQGDTYHASKKNDKAAGGSMRKQESASTTTNPVYEAVNAFVKEHTGGLAAAYSTGLLQSARSGSSEEVLRYLEINPLKTSDRDLIAKWGDLMAKLDEIAGQQTAIAPVVAPDAEAAPADDAGPTAEDVAADHGSRPTRTVDMADDAQRGAEEQRRGVPAGSFSRQAPVPPFGAKAAAAGGRLRKDDVRVLVQRAAQAFEISLAQGNKVLGKVEQAATIGEAKRIARRMAREAGGVRIVWPEGEERDFKASDDSLGKRSQGSVGQRLAEHGLGTNGSFEADQALARSEGYTYEGDEEKGEYTKDDMGVGDTQMTAVIQYTGQSDLNYARFRSTLSGGDGRSDFNHKLGVSYNLKDAIAAIQDDYSGMEEKFSEAGGDQEGDREEDYIDAAAPARFTKAVDHVLKVTAGPSMAGPLNARLNQRKAVSPNQPLVDPNDVAEFVRQAAKSPKINGQLKSLGIVAAVPILVNLFMQENQFLSSAGVGTRQVIAGYIKQALDKFKPQAQPAPQAQSQQAQPDAVTAAAIAQLRKADDLSSQLKAAVASKDARAVQAVIDQMQGGDYTNLVPQLTQLLQTGNWNGISSIASTLVGQLTSTALSAAPALLPLLLAATAGDLYKSGEKGEVFWEGGSGGTKNYPYPTTKDMDDEGKTVYVSINPTGHGSTPFFVANDDHNSSGYIVYADSEDDAEEIALEYAAERGWFEEADPDEEPGDYVTDIGGKLYNTQGWPGMVRRLPAPPTGTVDTVYATTKPAAKAAPAPMRKQLFGGLPSGKVSVVRRYLRELGEEPGAEVFAKLAEVLADLDPALSFNLDGPLTAYLMPEADRNVLRKQDPALAAGLGQMGGAAVVTDDATVLHNLAKTILQLLADKGDQLAGNMVAMYNSATQSATAQANPATDQAAPGGAQGGDMGGGGGFPTGGAGPAPGGPPAAPGQAGVNDTLTGAAAA